MSLFFKGTVLTVLSLGAHVTDVVPVMLFCHLVEFCAMAGCGREPLLS